MISNRRSQPMKMFRSICVCLVVCCSAALTGCARIATRPDTPSPVLPSAAPSMLVADEASADAAKATAVAAMAAYARPDLPFDRWWAGLEPLLSGRAIPAYQTVDPVNVPVTRVTGEASLPDWDTPRIARVGVPTDAGVYLVVCSRNEADPVWRVERFVPPEAR